MSHYPRGQCFPFEVLHDQVINAILVADVVEDADVGMIEAGDGLRFAFEPLAEYGVPGKVRGQNLNGDGSIETRIFGAIHFAHPTRADGRHNLVGSKSRPVGEMHGYIVWHRRDSG